MHALVARLRGTLLPAVVTPMSTEGVVAYDVLGSYAGALAAQSIGGLAVWAHTGRGLYLTAADRSKVLETWRQATDLPIVAGVGVPRSESAQSLQEASDATVAVAQQAAAGGADAVMVYPLAALGDLPDGHAQAVALHERVAAESGLPLVGFYLHGEAGGYPYSPELIRDLLSLDSMLGVKTATLDRAIGCQDAIWAGRGTGKLLITGEDRMYGPSFMWGADTALVGIAAAQVELSAAVLRTWTSGDHSGFLTASDRLDRFAAATFYAPIEGYVQRMLWAAVWEGLIPEEASHDPYGPDLPAGERDLVIRCLEELSHYPAI
ncbi:dihydrodipicolinate synthase family protein [Kribbella capetownensis]|uniref:Dihydrodipicolinate synthase family protein n=1 Tax=Kribbella capetownensis TaxID=1572659 RepID=A0A4R0JUT6_9ACTN|nr:dihydrodipicolinate synthase family protein [Kribbella capetownensis]TCC45985.1 dihydrodipicolinate synthase family protein [Kribbella capetownensis]